MKGKDDGYWIVICDPLFIIIKTKSYFIILGWDVGFTFNPFKLMFL